MPTTLTIKAHANQRARALELARLELTYQFDDSFLHRGASEEFLAEPPLETPRETTAWKPPKEMPAHLVRLCERKLLSPAEEQHLFRRMNFAKYRADVLRRKLNPQRPKTAAVAEIERLLEVAAKDRNEIVTANVRLVISIARKFVNENQTFDELLSEGIECLMRAVDKFDYSRGFRFSTYATTAIRHGLFRVQQNAHRDRRRLVLCEDKVLRKTPDRESVSPPDDAVSQRRRRLLDKLIRGLDQRQRFILARRFGLDGKGPTQTLQSLAHELGICKERVRQLEMRARDKIRALSKDHDGLREAW